MEAHNKRTMLDLFLDRTANESYSQSRLVTRETDSGNVALIAYGWLKLAEYNESRGVVTVFTGHGALQSVTVARYLNDVVRRANDRNRDIVLSGESPTVDTPNAGVQYIGNYISMDGTHSPVERDVKREVEESIVA